MKVAIMQPYFLPYIGYFQLMNAVDQFVVYDNIEFTRKGWIHRNRILVNGADAFVSLPLKKDSDYLFVKDRYLAETWSTDRLNILNRVKESYRKAPQFDVVFPLVERCLKYEESNLFHFLFNSLKEINQYLGIQTPLHISSEIEANHSLKSEEKVLDICRVMGATSYINPIGGIDLYQKATFQAQGIDLGFIRAEGVHYPQFREPFVPWLSILDVMMFNTPEAIHSFLKFYTIN